MRCCSVQGLLMHLEFVVVALSHGNSAAQSTTVPSSSLPESLQVSVLVAEFTWTLIEQLALLLALLPDWETLQCGNFANNAGMRPGQSPGKPSCVGWHP